MVHAPLRFPVVVQNQIFDFQTSFVDSGTVYVVTVPISPNAWLYQVDQLIISLEISHPLGYTKANLIKNTLHQAHWFEPLSFCMQFACSRYLCMGFLIFHRVLWLLFALHCPAIIYLIRPSFKKVVNVLLHLLICFPVAFLKNHIVLSRVNR